MDPLDLKKTPTEDAEMLKDLELLKAWDVVGSPETFDILQQLPELENNETSENEGEDEP